MLLGQEVFHTDIKLITSDYNENKYCIIDVQVARCPGTQFNVAFVTCAVIYQAKNRLHLFGKTKHFISFLFLCLQTRCT